MPFIWSFTSFVRDTRLFVDEATARDELDRVVEDELMDILLRWYVLLNLIDEHVMLVERDVFTFFFVQ